MGVSGFLVSFSGLFNEVTLALKMGVGVNRSFEGNVRNSKSRGLDSRSGCGDTDVYAALGRLRLEDPKPRTCGATQNTVCACVRERKI